MNFYEQIITAVYKFQSYPKLIMQRFGSVVCYLFLFTVIISVLSAIPYMISYKKLGGISGIADKYVPEFSIENGKLKCESIDYNDEMMGVRIYIDSNEKAESVDVGNSTVYIIADSDKMIVGNGMQKRVIEFSQFKGEYINKDMLIDFLSSKRVRLAMFTILMVTTVFSLCIGTLVWLIVLSAVASLINACIVRANIGYGDILKLCVYARTFPSIIVMIMGMFGMVYVEVLFWGLFITYVYLGLKNIKKQEAVILAEL